MLTPQDLKAIGQLIDKKVADDLAAIQTRLADLESNKSDSLTYVRLFNLVNRVETRMAALEHKFSKTLTKQDLSRFATKDDLKSFATKEDLKNFATKKDIERFVTKEYFEKQLNEVLDKNTEALVKEIRTVIDIVGEVLEKVNENSDILNKHERRLERVEDKVFA